MAYKRQSPMPIVEGGTNAQSMSTTNGVIYYDGTRLVTTGTGTAGQLLTSNGAAAPTYQPSGGGGGSTKFFVGNASSGFTAGSLLSMNDGVSSNFYSGIFGFGASGDNPANTDFTFPIPIAGTISNLYVRVTSNNATNSITYTMLKNNSPTALTVTIGAGFTGLLTDIAHSVAINAGDTIRFIAPRALGASPVVKGTVAIQFQS